MGKTNETPIQRQARRRKRRRRWLIALGIIVLIRIAIPPIAVALINRKLAEHPRIFAHIEDLDLALYRGAYVVKNLQIIKLDHQTKEKDTTPLMIFPEIDLSVQWSSVLKGRWVGEIEAESPQMNFIRGTPKNTPDTARILKIIDKLMPLTLNRVVVHNAQINYINQFVSPKVDVSVKKIQIVVDNLAKVTKSKKKLPAHMRVTAPVYDGRFQVDVDYNLDAPRLTFDLFATLKNVNLVQLNDLSGAFGDFQLQSGRFGFTMACASRKGKFTGYVQPAFKDIKVRHMEQEKGKIRQRVWEKVVGTTGNLLEKSDKQQTVPKIRLEGSFENPNISMWDGIGYLLKNAILKSLKPSFRQIVGWKEKDNDSKSGKDKKKKDDREKSSLFHRKRDKKKE